MKKYLYFVLAGVVAIASSCIKEPEFYIDDMAKPGSVCITVKMDPETKATIAESDGAFRFSSGDAIKIFDGTAVKSGTTTSTENTGSFTMEDGFNAEGSGYAGFPASLVSGITASGVVFALPTSYEYAAVGDASPDAAKVPVPMIGTYTGGNDISLKQAGALIRFRVTNVAAGTLTFTFPTNVTGKLGTAITTPSGTNDGILAANLTNVGKTITVTDVPEVTSGNYIFITLPVPTGTATSGIKVFNNGSSRMSAPTGSSTGLSRASGYKLGVYLGDNQGAKGGLFTVNASGDQVYFSQGNLRAVCTSADDDPSTQETWAWKFATNQYDYVGDNAANTSIDGNGSVSEPGTVDLFGWSTDATYYGINNSESADDYSGSFRDWGALIGSGWRTLSIDEWDYILVNRTNATAKYGFATVCGVHGIIILPDVFTDPMKNNGSGAFVNFSGPNWNVNVYSGTNWDAMEAAGAIFLPAAGDRWGPLVGNVRDVGQYWSSTPGDENKAWFRWITSIGTQSSSFGRNVGYSVRLVRDASNVPDQDPGMLSTPLTFEAKADGFTVTLYSSMDTKPSLQYRIDDGEWTDFTFSVDDEAITPSVNNGHKISFRATIPNSAFADNSHRSTFSCSQDCYIYGNIMSLLSNDGFATATSVPDYAFRQLFWYNEHILCHPSKALILPATTLGNNCYEEMFSGCKALTTAPALPATTLAQYCYCGMFEYCDALTTAPALPATTLAKWCYSYMFNSCTSLQTAPALPATSLAEDCYLDMFKNCESLVNAPELPATTLAGHCYEQMFAWCSQLASVPDLPATTLAEGCYKEMFSNCTSLTTAPTLPAPTLVDYCYYLMFEDCTYLNSVTCLATSISASYCTDGWLDDVASTGTFIKAPSMTGWATGTSGIPDGWTVSVAGGLSGKFTVADGKQVYFSQGNLQYTRTSTSDSWDTGRWSFMGHQYSMVETADQNVGGNYSNLNTISLFGWGTSGYSYGAGEYKPYWTSNGSSDYGPQNEYTHLSGNSDWGYNAISNGGNTENSGWRTLSADEWYYLFNTREGASSKYGFATVSDVNGVVVLPDSWIKPSDCDFISGGNGGWGTNNFDSAKWSKMEAAGAIFLPAAGYRNGDTAMNVSDWGCYWSSTNGGWNEATGFACSFWFYLNNFDGNKGEIDIYSNNDRCYGYSVRLVIDVI